ncbi:MAG TPA: hypothetical protein VFB54_02835 [Burkholderiales bacterium]|nr:hypothetical protein [Burkholderiales bacterium]
MRTLVMTLFSLPLLVALDGLAAAPAGAPAGSTGLCNDGTYYSGAKKMGACRGHQGVKEWWGEAPTFSVGKSDTKAAAKPEARADAKAAAATPAPVPAAAKPPAPAAAPAAAAPPSPKPPATTPTATTAAATTGAAAPAAAAPANKPEDGKVHFKRADAGGPGKVWANASTKVYHCPGDRWYGKTKEGEYMSEAEAKAKGFKPDHNKPCQPS